DPHAAPLEHAAEREDVAGVVVDQQNRAVDEVLIGAVETLQHALLFGGQVGHDAVQEEGGLVEQALRRLHAFHDDAARHRMEPGVLFGAELAAGKEDNRHVGQLLVGGKLFQHLKARHIGQAQVEHHAIGRLLPQHIERATPGAGGFYLDVVIAEQFRNAPLLSRVVFDHQQALPPRRRVFLDAAEGRLYALGGRRLADERERAAGKAVVLVLVERDDLDRDVPRQWILLELAEDAPAQHVRQEDVEGNSAWLILLGELQRVGPAHCNKDLETLVARKIDKHTAIMRIVFDDQQN